MAIPKYQHIKDELKQQTFPGKFENGDKFLLEAKLIKFMMLALSLLSVLWNDPAADGYIVRQYEKGPLLLVLENTNR